MLSNFILRSRLFVWTRDGLCFCIPPTYYLCQPLVYDQTADYSFRFNFFLKASMTGTVKVHNVSLSASEQDISEFFSFSGDIVYVELQRLVPYDLHDIICTKTHIIWPRMLCSCDERSQFAYITFGDNQGAERAMLLTVFVLPLVNTIFDTNYWWWCWS
jgi:hypothetical protein